MLCDWLHQVIESSATDGAERRWRVVYVNDNREYSTSRDNSNPRDRSKK